MCGICGEFNFRDGIVNETDIRKMSDALIHRGPDDSGIYCNKNIGLGHRRLSIIDISERGRQPIWSNDKSLCIVFNGEVYNFKEIKEDLLEKGYRFSSTTDTEVVVNAIHCFGLEEALSLFIGMFAFALWDKNKEKLYLVRDRAGIKPLFYYQNNDCFLFGSELRALYTHPSYITDISIQSLSHHFIVGSFLDNGTVFKNTWKLTPGHYLEINKKGIVRKQCYWDLASYKRGTFEGTIDEAQEQLFALFKSAFQYRMVSDVPVGLFLSGGIDSSLVSAILKKELNYDIVNITVGFDEGEFDETDKAKKVSEQLGVRQVLCHIDSKTAQEALLQFPEIYDEPFGDTSGIPTFILSQFARKHVKVALSADGGDEQFCGYPGYFGYENRYLLLKRIPRQLRLYLSLFLRKCLPYHGILSGIVSKKKLHSYNPQIISQYEKFLDLLCVRNEKELLRLMKSKAWTHNNIGKFLPLKEDDIFAQTVLWDESLRQHDECDLIDRMMRVDYNSFLRDDILTKVDRASMAVSLECRDPMLDHRISEFAFSLPIDFVGPQGNTKYILKLMLCRWIETDIIHAPKRGFMIPLYAWLKGAWKPYVKEYLSVDMLRSVGVLDEKKVIKEVELFYRYNGCRAEKIWMMLNFQMWAKKWYTS